MTKTATPKITLDELQAYAETILALDKAGFDGAKATKALPRLLKAIERVLDEAQEGQVTAYAGCQVLEILEGIKAANRHPAGCTAWACQKFEAEGRDGCIACLAEAE